jgi:hypothetical protein
VRIYPEGRHFTELIQEYPEGCSIASSSLNFNQALQASTIAGKGQKDKLFKFWATYCEVAKEHDDRFLDLSNSDMDIVLIFVSC